MRFSRLPLALTLAMLIAPLAGPAVTASAQVQAVPARYSWFVDARQNLISNNSAHTLLASAGTYVLRNSSGSAVQLVAAGGGNLVAAGGGNLTPGRSLMSAGDNRKVFVIK